MVNNMEKIISWIDRLSDYAAYLSGWLLIVIVLLILANVSLMAFFNKSIMITDEYSAYMFAAFVMFGLAYTLKVKGHIRINVLTSRLPNSIRRFFEIFAIAIAMVLTAFMFYYAILMVKQAYIYQMRSDTVAQTLLWIPQLCLPIGFFSLLLQLIAEFFKVIK